ncbi:uncharacterized protein TNCV_1561801 [Trichonephila clavipes]|nr:uncharacterized protein TNCV_1561801 [Trichonephila clavipes]
MGARLRKLKTMNRGKKLSDGKSISGKNRLTDKFIDTITTYYGNAIRQNNSSVSDMRQAIWAIYCHYRSTDEEPMHHFCPIGDTSWCQYQKAAATNSASLFKHKNIVPIAVMDEIKPIIAELAAPKLLKKCVGESYSKSINSNSKSNRILLVSTEHDENTLLNINATHRKIEELTKILYLSKVHIAYLQETKVNPNPKLKIKGFKTLQNDRKYGPGGGLAFLVKSADIKFREIALPPTKDYDENSTEVQSITVVLPQQEVTIINAYHPDNFDINLDLLNTLLDTKSDTKILLGDLNAKNTSWGSMTLDLEASQIEDLLCDNDLSILNDMRSTYLSKTNVTTSALHITAINHQTASQATWKILKSAISDHSPIITSINQRVDGTIQSKRS